MATTKIQWATKVWNPVTGCTKISEGCQNCYAEKFANRMMKNPNDKISQKYRYGFDPYFHLSSLSEPRFWKKPQRVFVCSMGDLFHTDIPFELIREIIREIHNLPIHTFMILTKRPHRMKEFFDWLNNSNLAVNFPNLWLGVTAENQQRADERIPILLQIPAAVRFISIEPMLGPVSLHPIAFAKFKNWLKSNEKQYPLDWIICGGETGLNSKIRPMEYKWVIDLMHECQHFQIPFFFKQWAGNKKIDTIDGSEYKQFPIQNTKL